MAHRTLPGLLGLISRVSCLIVIASFGIFAIDRMGSASQAQQLQIAGQASAPTGAPVTGEQERGIRGLLDSASERLTSPFARVTENSTSAWITRGADLLLALLVYGVGLAYVARLLRLGV